MWGRGRGSPNVGEKLGGKAIKAIIAALVDVLLYNSVRFELRVALGAIAALSHDVFVT